MPYAEAPSRKLLQTVAARWLAESYSSKFGQLGYFVLEALASFAPKLPKLVRWV